MDASASLRDFRWLTPERGRVYAVAAALVFVGALAGLLAALHGGYTASGLPFGMDFTSFWAASRLIWAGIGHDVYVESVLRLAQMPVLPTGTYEAFFYPPPYLLFCAPLAALPFFWSLGAFMGVTCVAYALAVRLASRSAWVVLAALSYPPVLFNVIAGQNGMLTAAIVGSGLTLMEHRPYLAGTILGAMVIKPHLVLAVPVALVLSRRWAVLGAAGLSALVLICVSSAVFGWAIWPAYLQAAEMGRRTMEDGMVPFARFQSVFAIARAHGVGVGHAYAIQGLSALAALGGIIRLRHASPAVQRSSIVLAGLLMTPFVLAYDLIMLAFPLVWLSTEWHTYGFPPWGKLILLVLFLLPVALFSPFGAPVLGMIATVFVVWLALGIH
jgi:hypothetical protein